MHGNELTPPSSDANPNLSQSEAEAVLKLFAQQERQRLQELERLQSMPRLGDVAELLHVDETTATDLLCSIRQVPPDHFADIPYADIRISEEEADQLINHHANKELHRVAELDRKVSSTSVEDLADALQVPPEQVSELLAQVRQESPPEQTQTAKVA